MANSGCWQNGRARAAKPTQSWLSNLPADPSLKQRVELTKQRWIIERDDLEFKQELGLGHLEDRSWRGFHHHATLCIAAYGFLVAERSRFLASARPAGSLWPSRHSRTNTGRGGARKLAQRVEPFSIASLRQRLAKAIARQLPRCPFCGARRL